MQNVVIDKPYHFVPPQRGKFWMTVLGPFLPRYLDREFGIAHVDCRGAETLKNSLRAGHGIVLAPNHCRPCDPMVLGILSREIGRRLFVMASAHLFMQGGFTAWLLPRAGAFSVYREGMDRSALNTAVDLLESAERPLVIFPEGVISRTNDRLGNLMEGTALIARAAARKRAKHTPPGRVVVHPVALKYFFRGDLTASLTPVLDDIERRFSWQPQRGLPLLDRVFKLGFALLCLKELEYFGEAKQGSIEERLARLIDHLLVPLESEWHVEKRDGDVVARVKRLRAAILPDMVKGEIADTERDRRWRQLADLYLAQQLNFYPPDYIRSSQTPERLLETVERFEEDLTDRARVHRPLHVIIQVGAAIEVSAERDRSGPADPLMQLLEEQLKAMLVKLSHDAAP